MFRTVFFERSDKIMYTYFSYLLPFLISTPFSNAPHCDARTRHHFRTQRSISTPIVTPIAQYPPQLQLQLYQKLCTTAASPLIFAAVATTTATATACLQNQSANLLQLQQQQQYSVSESPACQQQQYLTQIARATPTSAILKVNCSNTQSETPARRLPLQQQHQYSKLIARPPDISPLAAAILNANCLTPAASAILVQRIVLHNQQQNQSIGAN